MALVNSVQDGAKFRLKVPYPLKIFEEADEDVRLADLGLVPSAVIVVVVSITR